MVDLLLFLVLVEDCIQICDCNGFVWCQVVFVLVLFYIVLFVVLLMLGIMDDVYMISDNVFVFKMINVILYFFFKIVMILFGLLIDKKFFEIFKVENKFVLDVENGYFEKNEKKVVLECF